MDSILAVALLLAALGVVLMVLSSHGRSTRGLGPGRTVALDDRTLYSERLQLVGRPDRIVREGDTLIPEEGKSSRRASDAQRLQLGTYFILIEEEYGARPPHGVIVLGDGSRVVVENTEGLRSKVLAAADAVRRHRRTIREAIPVRQPAAKCRACGRRDACTRANL